MWCLRASVELGSERTTFTGYTKEYKQRANKCSVFSEFFLWTTGLHSHLCCPPKRDHAREPRRSVRRGRRRAGTTLRLHTLPEAPAAQTDTPEEPRATATTSATPRWRTGHENLRERHKTKLNVVAGRGKINTQSEIIIKNGGIAGCVTFAEAPAESREDKRLKHYRYEQNKIQNKRSFQAKMGQYYMLK